ncbi:MAG: MATE family efflux transporter [Coriobacteriales bacterium]
MPAALLFLRIYLVGLPAIMLYDMEAAVLRAVGRPSLPLRALAVSTGLNAIFAAFLIGAFDVGVAGAALATALSYMVGAGILYRYIRKEGLAGNGGRRHVDAHVVRSIAAIGIPAGIQGAVFAFSNTIIQASINSLGEEAIAGSSAAMSVEFLAYSLIGAFGQACSTFTGWACGTRDQTRCKKVLRTCIAEGMAVTLCLVVVMLVFGRNALAVFNGDAQVVELGYTRLFAVVPSYLFVVEYESLCGYLRGLGVPMPPAVVTTVVVCRVRIFWAFAVFPTSPTFQTIVLATPASLAANAVCVTVLAAALHPTRKLVAS